MTQIMARLNLRSRRRYPDPVPTRSRPVVQLAVLALLAAAVVVGAILISRGGAETPARTAAAPDVYAGIPQNGIRLGDPDARATLVEFADLQCPFCAQYAVEAMPTIVRDYVRTGRVAYELQLRSFLGPDSQRAAASAAAAAREDRLYQFVDAFYRNQGPENSGYVDDAFLRRIAGEAGVDPQAVVAAAADPAAEHAVRRAERLAESIGSNGTPDFYVRRGRRLQQLSPQGTSPEAYAQALDAALGG
jgi:protein-disulfide isomerase